MSVYTEIDEQKISQLCSQFGVSVTNIAPVMGGVQNSNWFIDGDNGKQYVLTLFERTSKEEVETLTILAKRLIEHDMPVAVPLVHETGLDFTDYQGKVLQLYPRLEGIHPEFSTAMMAEEMGRVMALLHDVLGSIGASETIIEKKVDWDARRDMFMGDLPVDEKKLMYKIWQKYTAATVGHDYSELPSGLIHADLFFDNTLWTDENLTGLLDFTEVRDDFLLMDIAITANDFCMDWEDMEYDFDKLDYFLKGYNNVRQLSTYEEEVLPIFLAMAAVRFWLFRLNMMKINEENERSGDKILVKSPELMRDLSKILADKIN